MTTSRTATIIGGGIAGAATAIGLVHAGWRVTVLEQAPQMETSGAALGMWPGAMTALDALGVGDAVRAVATPQGSGSLRRPDGRRIASIDNERLRRRIGDPVYLVQRRDLAQVLAAALPPGALTYAVSGTHDSDAARESDVVVAADGIFSPTRLALFGPRYRARYCGQTALRGRVALKTDAVSETWGPGCRFGVTPYKDATTNWYASISAPAGGRSPDGELALLRETFAGWHDPIPRIIDLLTEEEVMRHDLYDVHPPLPSYVAETVALVGDAAHAMTPDLGRGACEALVDAVALVRSLESTSDIPAALRGYDRARRRPTQRLQAMAYRLGRVAHARRLTGLRDVAVRLALALPVPM
jgi:2-polyprenyl-6-methoxyphenol hydroxylase-like FAD-dependent oxidoreductase